ncbi:thiol-disulfide oxidoreductase DCC family protein [Variovorax paradoxus]|uniref:thiol-disulfide oxidoreductase DCC family protein n=1 Tax=Variovorax paradoxus TaxID=34073 RepID=UPI003D6476E7
MAIQIFYDGDCPFCAGYMRLLRLREAHGAPELIDLRKNPRALQKLSDLDVDLDQGMMVIVDGEQYFGAQAMFVLNQLSTSHTRFNRINRFLFSKRKLANLVYPVLRAGRNITLFMMGRQRLVQQKGDAASFGLFKSAWGLFAFLHAISYSFFSYGSEFYLTTGMIGIMGVVLLLKPASDRAFCVLLLMLLVDAWLQMPLISNHTIIKNFFILAMLVAGIRQLLRGGRWSDFYADFAPVGRALLVTMYVFGIFHKLNRDFLDPAVSCAVVLWRAMPPPLSYIDSPLMHQIAIYGTFLVESGILVLLMARRTRHWGVAIGIGFHSLLALSSYAMYVQFSMLTIALHVLFIEQRDAEKIQSSATWQRLQLKLHTTRGYIAFATWLGVMVFLGWNGGYSEISIVWMPSVLLLAWLCLTIRHSSQDYAGPFSQFRSPVLLANVLSLAFFLNCAAPYLGLKTSQSVNMFANLQLEGGRSNHLLLSGSPKPFGYMADLVTVTVGGGSPTLEYVKNTGLKMTYYHLLDQLERNPDIAVSFERDGQIFSRQTAVSLSSEIQRVLHPRWIRNWFHFNVVDMTSPKPCAIDR